MEWEPSHLDDIAWIDFSLFDPVIRCLAREALIYSDLCGSR